MFNIKLSFKNYFSQLFLAYSLIFKNKKFLAFFVISSAIFILGYNYLFPLRFFNQELGVNESITILVSLFAAPPIIYAILGIINLIVFQIFSGKLSCNEKLLSLLVISSLSICGLWGMFFVMGIFSLVIIIIIGMILFWPYELLSRFLSHPFNPLVISVFECFLLILSSIFSPLYFIITFFIPVDIINFEFLVNFKLFNFKLVSKNLPTIIIHSILLFVINATIYEITVLMGYKIFGTYSVINLFILPTILLLPGILPYVVYIQKK